MGRRLAPMDNHRTETFDHRKASCGTGLETTRRPQLALQEVRRVRRSIPRLMQSDRIGTRYLDAQRNPAGMNPAGCYRLRLAACRGQQRAGRSIKAAARYTTRYLIFHLGAPAIPPEARPKRGLHGLRLPTGQGRAFL
jgi:hypothetical protein